jgi:hypothetical protein
MLSVGSGASKMCLAAQHGAVQKTAPLLMPCNATTQYAWGVGTDGLVALKSGGYYLKLNKTRTKTASTLDDFCKRGSVYLNNDESHSTQGFTLAVPPSSVGDFAATNKLLKSSCCAGMCYVASSTDGDAAKLELTSCDNATSWVVNM